MRNAVHALLAPYVLDALGEAERKSFKAHLDGCAMCQSELVHLRAGAVRLDEARPPLNSD